MPVQVVYVSYVRTITLLVVLFIYVHHVANDQFRLYQKFTSARKGITSAN